MIDYPGAQSPDRRRWVDAHGIRINVVEWGDERAPPLLLAHGGADFAQTFNVFAPLLAAGGWRVVSWDHRGHGDSERAALYSWAADVRDALCVLEATSEAPLPVVGHSKGGGLFSNLCAALPERFTRFVNIDGLPSKWSKRSQGMRLEERIEGRARYLGGWLDHRRRSHEVQRRPGALEELAERRARMNPRLSMDWLRYLVTVGADRGADGWRWKLDPLIRMGSPGPWRPDWGLRGLERLRVPMLALLGVEQEPMGWGTSAAGVAPHLPADAVLEEVHGCGHFVHIERPLQTAERVLQFLVS